MTCTARSALTMLNTYSTKPGPVSPTRKGPVHTPNRKGASQDPQLEGASPYPQLERGGPQSLRAVDKIRSGPQVGSLTT